MNDIKNTQIAALPVLAMRGVVLFPGMTFGFEVARSKSLLSIRNALGNDSKRILLLMQKDINVDDPKFEDLYTVGCVCEIKQVLNIPHSNNVHVVVEGLYRARYTEIIREKQSLRAYTEEVFEKMPERITDYMISLKRCVRSYFEKYAGIQQNVDHALVTHVYGEERLNALTDLIAGECDFQPEDKQALLAELDAVRRAELLCGILDRETDLLALEMNIHEKVQDRMDSNQREYYLREQIKVISGELGEEESLLAESCKFKDRIASLPIDEKSKKRLNEECDRLAKTAPGSPEATVSRTYLERVLSLPWGVYTEDSLDVAAARKTLEKDHYGLEEVKERILELIAVKRLAPDSNAQILCLVGPPGVGKTSIARSLAEALGRKYVRVSLGGVHDEAEIRGHRRTYIGSMPGRIISAIEQAETANPLILLDEIDKLGGDYKGDPSSALLEVLDGEQNNTFCDHYIDVPFDLSKVLFVTTANDAEAIPSPLYDRMEIIELYSYTSEDKLAIAKKHLIPRQLKNHGLTAKTLKFTDTAVRELIASYTREAGVRNLERVIAKVIRKVAVKIAEGSGDIFKITPAVLAEILGAPKYKSKEFDFNNMVGTANGLAWTAVGGTMMQIEVAVLDGKGSLELTGSLGDVMKESAKAAVSYIRSRASLYGIDPDFYKNKDIHIHVPEGAVPKDGPSAGVTITTALVSALSGISVKGDVAMTGEISLRGRVLPIGGLREKATAAFKNGMKTVIIPEDNTPDIEKINDSVKKHIEFVPVTSLDEVLSVALTHSAKPLKADSAAKNGASVKKNGTADTSKGIYCTEA